MVIVACEVPPVFVALTVYVAVGDIVVGVPLISPVDGLMLRPVGSAGEILHVSTAPPLDVGVAPTIGEPLVKVNGLPL